MRRTVTVHATGPHPSTRRDLAHTGRRRRARRRLALALALVVTVTTALPAVAVAGGPLSATTTPDGGTGGTGALPVAPGGAVRPLDTIEDEEAWCSYLSSYYLAFPSPWSARVINCRHSAMFVAPVYSDGSRGMCVLVPARHSRHLGGNIARWVTDIRIC